MGAKQITGIFVFFLAVQDSSIGDLVSQSVSQSVTHLLILASSEQCRAVVDLSDTTVTLQ